MSLCVKSCSVSKGHGIELLPFKLMTQDQMVNILIFG